MTQTILFTDDLEVIEEERHRVYVPEEEDTITFIDNDQIKLDVDCSIPVQRPTTSCGQNKS